jgi:hypothetical protein
MAGMGSFFGWFGRSKGDKTQATVYTGTNDVNPTVMSVDYHYRKHLRADSMDR